MARTKQTVFHDARKTVSTIVNVVLGEAIGQGGEGIVYKANHSSFGAVVVKEYLPKGIASRDSKGQVRESNTNWKPVFQKGLAKFIADGERLCQLDPHQNVVQFLELIKAEKTAFLVMRWVDGVPLKKLFEAGTFGGPEKVERLAAELASALNHLHHEDLLHLDVAPDNIIINQRNGRAVLIDFNAARNILTEATQSAEAFVKGGYSPIEQYSANPTNLKPASDIYAASAVLYQAMTGEMPISASDRSSGVALPLLAEQNIPGYRTAFLNAVDAGLARTVDKRPQSAQQWREMMKEKELVKRFAWPKITGTQIALGTVVLLIGGATLSFWNEPFSEQVVTGEKTKKELPAPPVAAVKDQIVLTAKADTWLRIYDTHGKNLFEKVLKTGEQYSVPEGPNHPLIQTGGPDQIMITIDGKEIGLLAPFQITLKDIILSKDGITATQQSLAAIAVKLGVETKQDAATAQIEELDTDSAAAEAGAAAAAAAEAVLDSAVDAASFDAGVKDQTPAIKVADGKRVKICPLTNLNVRSRPSAIKGQSTIRGVADPEYMYSGVAVITSTGDHWIKLEDSGYIYNGYLNGNATIRAADAEEDIFCSEK